MSQKALESKKKIQELKVVDESKENQKDQKDLKPPTSSFDSHVKLLSSDDLLMPESEIQRAKIIKELQQLYGNLYVQKVLAKVRERTGV